MAAHQTYFTTDWFDHNIPVFQSTLFPMKDKPLNCLEIGSWEGRSTLWLLKFLHPESHITCIDSFKGGMEHTGMPELKNVKDRFLYNISPYKNRVTVLEGYSHDMLKTVQPDSYDFIYIDGSHEAADVFIDLALSFLALKEGGLLLCDDYLGGKHGTEYDELVTSPKRSIDAFMTVFKGRMEVIHNGYQIHMRKLVKPVKTVYPITFSIPECMLIEHIPEKIRDFSGLIPGEVETYKYDTEETYYRQYSESYFAITKIKGGWDCLRHYEILAAGCIPYFIDLDKCPPQTMTHFPKELIKEAMNLPGVSYLKIDHSIFDKDRYFVLLQKLMDYTRNNLTTEAMAAYVLQKSGIVKPNPKILFLAGPVYPDYQRCLLLNGFKNGYQHVLDYPKIPHLYNTYADTKALYGKGFSYAGKLADIDMDRDIATIKENIKNRFYDMVIYGSIHRGSDFLDIVSTHYKSNEIIYVCGEDIHPCGYKGCHNKIIFVREL